MFVSNVSRSGKSLMDSSRLLYTYTDGGGAKASVIGLCFLKTQDKMALGKPRDGHGDMG